MSTFRPVEVTCPACGAQHTVEVLDGLHITRLPQVREDILEGRLQVFSCPSCGQENHVESDTVYTDFHRNHYVAVDHGVVDDWREAKSRQGKVFRDSFDGGPPIAQQMGADLVHRLVPDYAALREKLLVWDATLDDRHVEAAKAELLDEQGVERWEVLLRLSAVLDGGHLLLARLAAHEDGSFELTGHETVTADRHRRWRDEGDEAFGFAHPLLLDDWLVDTFVLSWANRPAARVSAPPGPKGRRVDRLAPTSGRGPAGAGSGGGPAPDAPPADPVAGPAPEPPLGDEPPPWIPD